MKKDRQLKITVKGKAPNTVTLGISEAVKTEGGGETKTVATGRVDDYPIGTALVSAVTTAVTDFIDSLQEDEGPSLFDKKEQSR